MNIVCESLNELRNFERKRDPLSSLGVGQRKLIKDWLEEMDVKNYMINDDLTIDVKGSVNLNGKDLAKFPDYIQFGKIIKGWFYCADNQLISLKGCPNSVTNWFSCSRNKLTSLKDGPNTVGTGYDCRGNELESLDYCATTCGGLFHCDFNPRKFTKEDVLKVCKVKRSNIYC